MSNVSLIAVTKGATALDVLAEHYRAAFDKTKAGREQWIEGTLELAAVVAEARGRMPDHRAFGEWIERSGLQPINKDARTALLGFAKDLGSARKLLEQTDRTSWHWIWASRPQRTLLQVKKGRTRDKSGWQKRNYVPEVMQEQPMPPLPPPRRRLSDMGLTPEQVDPDFKGTHLEFKTKYGHVNLHTKDQIQHHKQQEALAKWIGTVLALEKAGRMMLGALSKLDPATITEWKGKNGKADKLRAWYESIQTAADALGNSVARR